MFYSLVLGLGSQSLTLAWIELHAPGLGHCFGPKPRTKDWNLRAKVNQWDYDAKPRRSTKTTTVQT